MKFSSVLAFGSFLLPALATPILGTVVADVAEIVGDVENLVEDITGPIPIVGKVLSDVIDGLDVVLETCTAVVPVPVKAKRGAISSPQDVIDTCNGLLVQIKVYTGAINKTVAGVPEGSAPADADVLAIKVQLNLIISAVKTVVLALGAVGGLISCTVEEVTIIVGCVVAIILEIACTLLNIVKCLDIEALLVDIISALCTLLAGLVLVLEHIVGGVLDIVLHIINLPNILCLLQGLLAALVKLLATGHIAL